MNIKRMADEYRSRKIDVVAGFENFFRTRLMVTENIERYWGCTTDHNNWVSAKNIEGWRKRLIRDGVPEEDLTRLYNVGKILKESDQYFPYNRRDGGHRKCSLEDKTPLLEIAARAIAELNEFQKELPALIEKWLAKFVREADIKV